MKILFGRYHRLRPSLIDSEFNYELPAAALADEIAPRLVAVLNGNESGDNEPVAAASGS